MKLFFLLCVFTINAPFNNPPLWTNQELTHAQNHPHQSAQQMPYEVYVPIEYAYDPASYYNQYMDMQTPYYQNTHNVPIHTQSHLQSHQTSHIVPIYMQTIPQPMPLHQLHVHPQSISMHPITKIQTNVHPHTFSHGVQPSMQMIQTHIPNNYYFVNQQPSMAHSIGHVVPHNQYQYMSHLTDSPVYMEQYYNQEQTTVVHTMDQPQPVVQDSIALLDQHNISAVELQDDPVDENQNSKKNPKDPISDTNTDSTDQENLLTAAIHNPPDIKLQERPSGKNPALGLVQRFPMPEFEKTIEKLYELAHAANVFARDQERRVVLSKIQTIAEKCLLLCILNILIKKGIISKNNSIYCCRRHLRKERSDIELYIVCGEYNKIFLNISPQDLSNLKAIFPPMDIPFVNFVVSQQD